MRDGTQHTTTEETQTPLGTLEHLESLDITGSAATAEPQIDLRALKSLKTVYAYESDERKILVPDGCVVITFD